MMRRAGIDPTLSTQGLTGEELLVGAILRQALTDAKGAAESVKRQEAMMLLRDQERINWWAELTGVDGDVLGETLRHSVGLE